MSGDIDYMSFSCFPDIQQLNQACDELGQDETLGILHIQIRMIMERTKWYLGYPLEKLKWID